MSSFKVSFPVSQATIESLLCSAFEGGSNYWARAFKGKKPIKKCEYIYQYPLFGGSFFVVDLECDDGVFEVTQRSLVKGLKAMSKLGRDENGEIIPNQGSHNILDVLSDEADATTGDVFLQCCVFGEIMYGG